MAISSEGLSRPAATAKRRPWFTLESLASYLQVSERMVRKWVTQGRLRSYKLDGCRRFDPADVDAFVAQFRDERGRGQ
jgi:excisionase family DNA binding protein